MYGATLDGDRIPLMNVLRRLPLSRLLFLCGLLVAVGVSLTALASALNAGPTPSQKPLAQAVHDALIAPAVEGISAEVTLTDHLFEGANLASSGGQGGGLTSSPLVTGGSGRLWASKSGKVRLELQDQKGDINIVYDGHMVTMYDAANNTIYRYTPPRGEGSSPGGPRADPAAAVRLEYTNPSGHHEIPSVAKIQEAIDRIRKHANLSEPTPTDIAGQPAYTVRISPDEGGSLIGGAELSFDSVHGTPLRAAIYSSQTSAPTIELAVTEISYGPVESSVFAIEPPANAKVEDVSPPTGTHAGAGKGATQGSGASATRHGSGITSIVVAQSKVGSKSASAGSLESLPTVDVNGAKASELRTELGTVLSFERAGVRYLVAGALGPATVEALARSL
jgi:outer membrane lipoprotein-sorting protein